MIHIIYEKYSVTLPHYLYYIQSKTIKYGRKMRSMVDKMKENALFL